MHYLACWGTPSRMARFQAKDDDFAAEIYKWSADTHPSGVNLYATIGASARPIVGRESGHRIEFFIGLRPEKDEVASALAALALYPARQHLPVGHGDTVPAGGSLWQGTDMNHFLIMRPIVEIIEPAVLTGGIHVEYLQALPMHPAEVRYKIAHSAEALMQLWQASGVAFWDPNRLRQIQ